MFDFDEIKTVDDDENISVGSDEELEGVGPNVKPKKEGDDSENWGLEEDLEEEGNM